MVHVGDDGSGSSGNDGDGGDGDDGVVLVILQAIAITVTCCLGSWRMVLPRFRSVSSRLE